MRDSINRGVEFNAQANSVKLKGREKKKNFANLNCERKIGGDYEFSR